MRNTFAAERLPRALAAPIAAVSANSLLDLRESLAEIGLPTGTESWVVADLSMGAWTVDVVAQRFLAQLGSEVSAAAAQSDGLGNADLAASKQGGTLETADRIGDLVDAEAAGDTAMVRALSLARETVRALTTSRVEALVVLAPRFGNGWRGGDVSYLRFLSHGLQDLSTKLVVGLAHDATPWPDGPLIKGRGVTESENDETARSRSLSSLIPDSLRADVVAELVELGEAPVETVPLRDRTLLVDPAVRARPAADRRILYDRLTTLDTIPSWMQAYAHRHGTGYHCDPAVLIAESWRQFGLGGDQIALDLMEHVVASASDSGTRAQWLYELQGMRIALQRFEDILAAADVGRDQPEAVRGGLLLTKGWAHVMDGDPVTARRLIEEARDLLRPSLGEGRQALYVENIYALSLLKTGEADRSLDREKAIEQSLAVDAAVDGIGDCQLTYVNSINQARLSKYAGNFDEALRYYRRAFGTTLGARSESDNVYAAASLARLYDEHGHHELAHAYWFRAGLHWVAAEVPEALAPRAAAGVVDHRVTDTFAVVDEISEVLYTELARRGSDRVSATDHAASFVRSNALSAATTLQLQRLVGGAHWSVFTSPDVYPVVLEGAIHRQLRALLTAYVQRSAGAETPLFRTVVLPIAATADLAATRSQKRDAAALFAVSEMRETGEVTWLTEREQGERREAMGVSLGYCVKGLCREDDGDVTLRFKRYRKPAHYAGLPAAILDRVASSPAPLTLAQLSGSITSSDPAMVEEAAVGLFDEFVLRRETITDR